MPSRLDLAVRGSALVLALAAQSSATYPIDVRATPTLTGARLRIAVKQSGAAATVRRFTIVHEHPMHVFVVGEGLDFFVHEHPAPQPDGVFMVDLTLPRAGPYMAIVEFQPEGGAPQMTHQAFTTGTAFGRPARPPIDTAAKIVDGMRVSLDVSKLKAGEAQPLVLLIEDPATNAPIADLDPYLDADAHLIAVSPDATEAIHDHPQTGRRTAPITFRPLIPRAGLFKTWVQFQRAGRLTTATFVIDVP